MSKKSHTTYIDRPVREGEQKQEQPKPQQKGGGTIWTNNKLTYLVRVAWRFYTHLFEETVLAFILIAPVYLYCTWYGIKEITLPMNLPVLLGIATLAFVMQGLMFRK